MGSILLETVIRSMRRSKAVRTTRQLLSNRTTITFTSPRSCPPVAFTIQPTTGSFTINTSTRMTTLQIVQRCYNVTVTQIQTFQPHPLQLHRVLHQPMVLPNNQRNPPVPVQRPPTYRPFLRRTTPLLSISMTHQWLKVNVITSTCLKKLVYRMQIILIAYFTVK